MFSSVKEWLDTPIKLRPFDHKDDYGDKYYKSYIDTYCMPEAKIQVVVNKLGEEKISSTTLYMDNTHDISEDDQIRFNGVDRDIQAIGAYYKYGKVNIWLVYI